MDWMLPRTFAAVVAMLLGAFAGMLVGDSYKATLLGTIAGGALAVGTVANLSISLPGSEIVLVFSAELVHREETRLGFKFLQEDLETLTHLRTLLELNTGDPEGVRSELLAWLNS